MYQVNHLVNFSSSLSYPTCIICGWGVRSFRDFCRYFGKRVILESKLSGLDFSFILVNKAFPRLLLKYILFFKAV